ncbi:MAG: hypothetical protein LBO06_06490 [Bacteroidales bacterium]|jgi:hypothetical protein|nr:hypothetical protein [Bacteroidales bacterium]
MIVESIIISVGGVFVMAIAGYVFVQQTKKLISQENKRAYLELHIAQQNEITKLLTPIKLQAYERLIMLLERIKPENLVMRCYSYGMETSLLKDVMLKNIRDEYDYNLSQQLYVSEQSWARVMQAKEETIALINGIASSNAEKILSPTDFSAQVFEKMTSSASPIQQAQATLKQELNSLK